VADEVTCTGCGGAGRVPLSRDHALVLRWLRRLGDTTAGALCAMKLFQHVTHTAMCNRLAYLERAGFAASQRRGRRKVYWPTGGVSETEGARG
jgi:hypothetical protein